MHERIARRHQESSAFMKRTDEEHAELLMRRLGARPPRDIEDEDDGFGLVPSRPGPAARGSGTGRRAPSVDGGDEGYAEDSGAGEMQGFVDPEVRWKQSLRLGFVYVSCRVMEAVEGLVMVNYVIVLVRDAMVCVCVMMWEGKWNLGWHVYRGGRWGFDLRRLLNSTERSITFDEGVDRAAGG